MTTADRISILIQSLGLNGKTFSEQCGYERPQVIYDIMRGRTRNISAAMADRITAAFPDVNRVWLLTGSGQMTNSAEPDAYRQETAADEVATKVPLIPMSAIAGPLASYHENGVDVSRCPRVVSPAAGAELALPVSGDSMEPVFADGSIIFIKRINEAAFIPWGHPMVLDTENGVFIKTVMPDEENTSYIWAESINPRYPRMHIPKRSVAAMYRVLTVTKSFSTM